MAEWRKLPRKSGIPSEKIGHTLEKKRVNPREKMGIPNFMFLPAECLS